MRIPRCQPLVSVYLAIRTREQTSDTMRRFAVYLSGDLHERPQPRQSMMSMLRKIPICPEDAADRSHTSSEPGLLQPIIDLIVRYKIIPRGFPPRDMYWSA